MHKVAEQHTSKLVSKIWGELTARDIEEYMNDHYLVYGCYAVRYNVAFNEFVVVVTLTTKETPIFLEDLKRDMFTKLGYQTDYAWSEDNNGLCRRVFTFKSKNKEKRNEDESQIHER